MGTRIQTLTPLCMGRNHSVSRSSRTLAFALAPGTTGAGRCVPEGGGLEIIKPFLSFLPSETFCSGRPCRKPAEGIPHCGRMGRAGGEEEIASAGQAAGREATSMGSWSWEGSRGRTREEGSRAQGRPPVSAVVEAHAVSLWWPVGWGSPSFSWVSNLKGGLG